MLKVRKANLGRHRGDYHGFNGGDMTEDEAKTKWCPMVRFVIGDHNALWQGKAINNRYLEMEPNTCLCIASQCMMWADDGRCGLIKR